MKYTKSKYLFDFLDEGMHIVYSMMTTSFIALEDDKYNALMQNELQMFTDDELDALLQMGFVYNAAESEFALIQQKRNRAFRMQADKDDQLSLVVLPTTECNARCYYCYEHGIKKEFMSNETADSIIEFIKNRANKVHIKWFGGEPTLAPELIDRICGSLAGLDIEFATSFVSNGYLLNEEFVDKAINDWNFKSVQITIDAVGEEYNKIKNYVYSGENSPFDIVMNNIKTLIEKKVYVNIRINYNPIYYQKAIEVIDYIHQAIGVNEYLVVYSSSLTGEHIKRLIDYNDDFNPQIEIYKHLINKGYLKELDMMNLYPRLLNCTIHYDNAYIIDTRGKLYKCQHSIINQEKDSIGTLTSQERYEDILKKWDSLNFSYEECQECKYLPICLGGCRFYALNNEKFYACYQLKNSFISLIKMLYEKFIKGGAI